jgi:hypothetical protein
MCLRIIICKKGTKMNCILLQKFVSVLNWDLIRLSKTICVKGKTGHTMSAQEILALYVTSPLGLPVSASNSKKYKNI